MNGATLAKINAVNATLNGTFNFTSWTSASVYALALDGASLFIGGNFSTYRGSVQGAHLAKVSTSNGTLDTTVFNNISTLAPGPSMRSPYLERTYSSGAHSLIIGVILEVHDLSV